ncbi:Diphthine methyl ester synthase [Pseudolycoriella hygida]|uniref:diphthine methyl ester synthase n=1 Tax=Pseudolycoriella hygida TaxID=35572 RepID=A0A9Q0MWF3_9DIPT|nr:Diphthine methyl ester synthase [Pseudolycoriella hygida]
MFYIIGLGLGDPKDVTVKGLEIIKKCERVYLESYTSILTCGQKALEDFYGRPLIIADRDMVEQDAATILADSDRVDVALLVVGDPFGATTHTDVIIRAKEMNIAYQVIHNASIMNAIGCCGLQLYSFGETISIPYWSDTWQPDSFYDKIKINRDNGLHTLCLLDIRVKEPTLESIMKKKKEYQPPRFMSVAEAAGQLLQIVKNKRDGGIKEEDLAYNENSLFVGVARVGHDTQSIVVCKLHQMAETDLGAPLHSLVLPAAKLHPIEVEYMQQFADEKLQENVR